MKKKGNSGLRWVVGAHSVREALRAQPQWVSELVIQENRERDHQELEALAKKKSIATKNKGPKFFNALADGHQGVAAALTDRPRWDDEMAQKAKSLVVFLDGITDPHNLGAILRTAWLLEADAIFIPKNRAVDLTPVVCKVASGGAEHVPVESVQFQSQLSWFKEQGYWVYGLGENSQQRLNQTDFGDKAVLVVGAEGKGMRSSTEGFCDQIVSIPQVEGGSSYNASVAFALCAYECRRSTL